MKKIKFAVMGFGHIGKKHADVIRQNKDAELVAVIDIAAAKINQQNPNLFFSLTDFFKSGIDVDVINIATPNSLHASQAVECLYAGKHVVIEKPMALKTIDAQKIINAAGKNNKQVFVVMQLRYSPIIVWLKKLIDENILGRIFMVQMNCFWNRDERYYTNNSWHTNKQSDGGTLFTQFSHFIDIFYWLFGDIKNISSNLKSFNHQHLTDFEDSGIVQFEFGKNALGSLNFSTSVFNKNLESSITIIAENGSIKISGQYMNTVEYCDIKDYVQPQQSNNKFINNHQFIIQNVVDVLNGNDITKTNAFEGLKVVDIIERMYNSVK